MSENADKLLDRLIVLTEKHAHNVLINLGQDLVPTWALFDLDKDVSVIPTPWANNDEKQATIFAMKFYMRLKHVVVYSFITEAWLAKLSVEEWTNPMGVVSPSERVDRREVVIACAATANEVKWARWGIERNDDGKVTGLVSEPMIDDGTKADSWIGGMLK